MKKSGSISLGSLVFCQFFNSVLIQDSSTAKQWKSSASPEDGQEGPKSFVIQNFLLFNGSEVKQIVKLVKWDI